MSTSMPSPRVTERKVYRISEPVQSVFDGVDAQEKLDRLVALYEGLACQVEYQRIQHVNQALEMSARMDRIEKTLVEIAGHLICIRAELAMVPKV